MSRPSSPALHDSAGLPSYEHSVQEKRARHSTRIVDEDGFLVYDAAVFDAVADSYNPPPSSSRTPKRDLKLAVQSLKSSRPPTRPSRLVIVDGSADDSDDSDEQESPPPPFTPTAPSADRSPFGQVAYPPHNGPDSRPSSPLASPPFPTSRHTHNFSPQAPQSFHTSPRPPHHTFPSIAYPSGPSAIARSSPPTAPRNVSSAMTSRMSFDPSVAYAKPHASQGSPTSVSGGASAFYNAAVTPHLPTRSPPTYPNTALSTPPRGHRATASFSTPSQQFYGMRDSSDRASMYSFASSSFTSSNQPLATPSNRPLGPPPGAGVYNIGPSNSQSPTAGGGRPDEPQWAASEAHLFNNLYNG